MPRNLLALIPLLLHTAFSFAAPLVEFELTLDAKALDKPFTGRVYVLLSKFEPRQLPNGLNWFNPEPAFAENVREWKPGTTRTLGVKAIAFPTPLKDLKPGKWFAQAVIDRDLGGISFAASPGNVYSKPVAFTLDPEKPSVVALSLDLVHKETPFKETEQVKYVELESPMLTKFHGKPTKMRAGVILPPSFEDSPKRKYPVVYEITGFGGDHTFAPRLASRKPGDLNGTEAIWVVLDANCRLGHHVFADSANNGPVRTALVEAFIPHIEKTFRGTGKGSQRLVTGHSSGGWSSLWLQVAYPDAFNGCWSTSPDPVDFRDFQRVNLYEPKSNLFTDADGKPRDLARSDRGKPLQFQAFSDMEVLMGRGGQLASFEAVFSPKDKNGQPRKLWDRTTGAIDPVTAKSWEPYDIRRKLDAEWPTLKPKLLGKLHVYMGDIDTFYLDGAARLLKKSLDAKDYPEAVEMFPKKTHALVDADLRKRMNREMADRLKIDKDR